MFLKKYLILKVFLIISESPCKNDDQYDDDQNEEQQYLEEQINDERYDDEQYNDNQYDDDQYEEQQYFDKIYKNEQLNNEQYDRVIHHLNIKTQCNLNIRPSYVQCTFATSTAGQLCSSSNEYNIHINRKFVSKNAFYEEQKKFAKPAV